MWNMAPRTVAEGSGICSWEIVNLHDRFGKRRTCRIRLVINVSHPESMSELVSDCLLLLWFVVYFIQRLTVALRTHHLNIDGKHPRCPRPDLPRCPWS